MGAQEVCAMSRSYRHLILRIERRLDIHPGSPARLLLAIPPGVLVATFVYMTWAFLVAGIDVPLSLGGTIPISFITMLLAISLLLAFRHDSPEEAPGLRLFLRLQDTGAQQVPVQQLLGRAQRAPSHVHEHHR